MATFIDGLYVSDSGYSTVDTPKKGSSYDWGLKRHVRIEKYTLEKLQASEKEYNKFLKVLKSLKLESVIKVRQVTPADRSAMIYFAGKEADYYVNNMMTFHLQKGVIYNLPVNKMRKAVDSSLTNMSFDDFNKGVSVKEAKSIIGKFLKQVEKLCLKNGVEFTDEIKTLAFFGLSGKFVYDVKLWNDYLSAGLSPVEVSFGLSKELNPKWQSDIYAVTPETAKGLKDVPIEWVRNLLLG